METLEKIKIPNDYSRFRNGGLDGTIKLPLGWSSHYDKDGSSYYYKYDNAPPTCTFWYPIPTLQGIQPASDLEWGPILYTRTLRGYLDMGSPFHWWEGYRTYHTYSLHTSEGTWAGVIFVHHSPESASEQNQRCELVLISGGWAIEDKELAHHHCGWFPEWFDKKRPRSGDYYHFYHVLWIEWQDNIAYRKGLGRVVKKVWDDLPKDEIELSLG